MFLRNCWYVAAQAADLGREPVQRWIVGEPVVLYCTLAGEPVALEDRCPHRRAPLSKGRLVGDALQCGYHGMTFDCAGSCIRIPGQERIPAGLKLRSYPVVRKWGWIWVWMGEPALADPALVPDFQYNDAPGWVVTGGCIRVKANYQLLTDNLLDLTHETFVHGRTIGNAVVAETPMSARVEGNEVHVERIIRDASPPPLFKRVRGIEGNIDRWQIIRYQAPANITIDARGFPTGTQDLDRGLRWFSTNSITPVDEGSSDYYWTITRCFAQDDQPLTRLIHDQILATFMEDVEILESQQLLIQTDRPGRQEFSTAADRGSVAARRILQQLIQDESARS